MPDTACAKDPAEITDKECCDCYTAPEHADLRARFRLRMHCVAVNIEKLAQSAQPTLCEKMELLSRSGV